MSDLDQSDRDQLINYAKTSVLAAYRRGRSLDAKLGSLFERSPEVRRFLAYREAVKRTAEDARRAEHDLAYWVLRDGGPDACK